MCFRTPDQTDNSKVSKVFSTHSTNTIEWLKNKKKIDRVIQKKHMIRVDYFVPYEHITISSNLIMGIIFNKKCFWLILIYFVQATFDISQMKASNPLMIRFAERACKSYDECKALPDTNEAICAVHLNNGSHIWMESKCLMLKYNCEMKSSMYQVLFIVLVGWVFY